jgi:peptidylglycine monooxygenase
MEATVDEGLTVTLGSRRYGVTRGWGAVPEEFGPLAASQVAVDSRGYVHLFRRGDPPVLVFDSNGHIVHHYGAGRIADAHGIFIGGDDRVFLVDRDAHQVHLCDREGNEIARLGERHRARWGLPFNHPTDAAVADDGEIYISDGYGNAAVHRFSADGQHLASWGAVGRGEGEFMTPHAIWVDQRDRVLVADRENDRIQLFSRDGQYLESWHGLFHPMDLFVDGDGLVYVTDQIPSLTLFDPEGTRIGRCRPALNVPHGLSGDRAGNLFVAEMQPSSIVRLGLV